MACLMFIDRGHVKLHVPLQEQKGDHSDFNLWVKGTHAHMDLLQEDILLIPSTSFLLTFFSGLGNLALSPVVFEHLYPFLGCWVSLYAPWTDDRILWKLSEDMDLAVVSPDNKTTTSQIL